jgi:hypothetical protein
VDGEGVGEEIGEDVSRPRQDIVFDHSPYSCKWRHLIADSLKAKDKVENPQAHFDKPKEALNTWEQDERQLLTASNEGMSGSKEGRQSDNDNRLGEVVRTKEKISAHGTERNRTSRTAACP